MALSTLSIVNGILSLIFCTIAIIVGITITSKYFTHKQRIFLFVGIAWIGLSEPWLGSSISFLLFVYTGKGLTPELYAIISMVFIPFSIILWIAAWCDLILKKNKKLLISIYMVLAIIFEIALFSLLAIDPSLIIILRDPIDAEFKTVIMIFLLLYIFTILITGIIFAIESLKSDNPEIRLKGKLLLAAFLSWPIGAILDGVLPLNFITLTFTRILLISSAIEFYCGFLLPNWIKKVFLKQK